MPGAWPPMPEWLGVDVAPNPVRRGERVRVRWDAVAPPDGHELRLALIVHKRARGSTLELPDRGGRFAIERQIWDVHDRVPVDGSGAVELLVPAAGPYSYPGTVLAFFWGIALAAAGDPIDRPLGWTAVEVLP